MRCLWQTSVAHSIISPRLSRLRVGIKTFPNLDSTRKQLLWQIVLDAVIILGFLDLWCIWMDHGWDNRSSLEASARIISNSQLRATRRGSVIRVSFVVLW
jgi:hypothetical protein